MMPRMCGALYIPPLQGCRPAPEAKVTVAGHLLQSNLAALLIGRIISISPFARMSTPRFGRVVWSNQAATHQGLSAFCSSQWRHHARPGINWDAMVQAHRALEQRCGLQQRRLAAVTADDLQADGSTPLVEAAWHRRQPHHRGCRRDQRGAQIMLELLP